MHNERRVVIVPVDFFEQSLIALEQAVSLSGYYNTKVKLVHVKDTGLGKFFKSTDESVNIEERLEEISRTFSKPGVPVEVIVDQGIVHERITSLALKEQAVFIVMGVNSGSRLKKRLIGDTALKVVRESQIPVITIKGKHHRAGCKNIVLPLDLTKETTQKVSHAIEFAKYGKCAIRVLSVLFSKDDFVTNKLVRQMEEVRNEIVSHGIECTAELVKAIKGEETAAQVIIDYASKVDGDLIMIMTQKEAALKESILGSTAEEIIMDSSIPVLSIIPKKIK